MGAVGVNAGSPVTLPLRPAPADAKAPLTGSVPNIIWILTLPLGNSTQVFWLYTDPAS